MRGGEGRQTRGQAGGQMGRWTDGSSEVVVYIRNRKDLEKTACTNGVQKWPETYLLKGVRANYYKDHQTLRVEFTIVVDKLIELSSNFSLMSY